MCECKVLLSIITISGIAAIALGVLYAGMYLLEQLAGGTNTKRTTL